jgi:hypothetical protein
MLSGLTEAPLIILDAMDEDGVLLVEASYGVADKKTELPPWSGIRCNFAIVF